MARSYRHIQQYEKEILELKEQGYCTECGCRLSRIGGNSKYEKWDCRNPDCFRLEYRLTDQMIIGAVLTVLNSAIANPNLLESGGKFALTLFFGNLDICRIELTVAVGP